MVAVTFIGPNPDGITEDFPAACREGAESILPGESALMTLEEYRAYKAAKDSENAAVLDALRSARQAAAAELSLRTEAKMALTELDGVSVRTRALVLVLIDEINTVRTELNKAKANITTWRAEPALPMRTLTQAKNAIAAAIDNKTAD